MFRGGIEARILAQDRLIEPHHRRRGVDSVLLLQVIAQGGEAFECVRLAPEPVERTHEQPAKSLMLSVLAGEPLEAGDRFRLAAELEQQPIPAFDGGEIIELGEGSLFHIPAVPHDSWVVGDKPYVSLHLMGAEHYAK